MRSELRPHPFPWGLSAALYALLIAYGSLYPFTDWRMGSVAPFAFLVAAWPSHISKVDMLTNLLAYGPLGIFLACWLRPRHSLAASTVIATLVGAGLSFTIECVQQFVPTRIASTADLAINVLGTAVGASIAAAVPLRGTRWTHVTSWRERFFVPGPRAEAGILAILLWALAQTTPLVPSIDFSTLRHGASPLWRFIQHPDTFNVARWASYTFNIAGLLLVARTIGAPGHRVGALFFGFALAVLLYKIPVVTRQLSIEAVLGLLAGGTVTLPLARAGYAASALAGSLLIVGGFAVAELSAAGTAVMHPFNWIPFRGQLENTLNGIESILESIWPAAALAYFALSTDARTNRARRMWGGGLALALISFGLEWRQQFIPGRFGDITTVLLMVGTWFFVWRFVVRRSRHLASGNRPISGGATGPS